MQVRLATYLAIAAGGAAGAGARHFADVLLAGDTFPLSTWLVNLSGCLLIGAFARLVAPEGRLFVSTATRHGVMTGLLGGFTTFSVFSLENLELVADGALPVALAYILATLVGCLVAVWAGDRAARILDRMD